MQGDRPVMKMIDNFGPCDWRALRDVRWRLMLATESLALLRSAVAGRLP